MVRINKIYTRSGDEGETGLVGGKRVRKNSLRVKCYGDLDELNSFIGWARGEAAREGINQISEQLAIIQNELFDLGAYLATPQDSTSAGDSRSLLTLTQNEVDRLEKWIDNIIKNLPELKSFVLPGGSNLNSLLHVCRTICRRTERALLDLDEKETVDPLSLKYINRLSDYFFALARFASAEKSIPEFLWKPKA